MQEVINPPLNEEFVYWYRYVKHCCMNSDQDVHGNYYILIVESMEELIE